MPTVILTAFDSVIADATGQTNFVAAAAGWSATSVHGDTGTHVTTAVGNLFSVAGFLTDSGAIPLDAIDVQVTVHFDWVLECAGSVVLTFFSGVGEDPVPAPGDTGSFVDVFDPQPRADVFATGWGWSVGCSGSADDARIVVSNWSAVVTYSLPTTAPTITLNTLDARTRRALTIHDVLNDSPNTCSLTVETGTTSPLGKAIRISSSPTLVLLFTGTIQTVSLSYDGTPDAMIRWACTATDDLARFNRRLPFGSWTSVSATDVATELISTYAPAFSAAGIEAGLPTVTVRYDGGTTLAGAFAEMAHLIGGAFKTEDGVVYLFLSDTTDPPDDIDDTPGRFLDDPHITMTVDLSQIRTRVYVRGAGSGATGVEPITPPDFNLTLTASSGGALLPSANYTYAITATGTAGESLSTGGIGTTLGGGDDAMLVGGLDASISVDPRCTGRKLYRTSGPGTPGHGLIATFGNDAGTDPNTFLDTVDGDLLDGTRPPLVETTANIFTMVEDTVAQAALATLEGGGSDGIVEHHVLDTALTTTDRAIARGEAELALFAYPLVTVTYATRDTKTKSGKTVHVEVTTPPIGPIDLLIQDVAISHLDLDGGPIFQVTASSVRFSLEAILRMALKAAA